MCIIKHTSIYINVKIIQWNQCNNYFLTLTNQKYIIELSFHRFTLLIFREYMIGPGLSLHVNVSDTRQEEHKRSLTYVDITFYGQVVKC